MKLRDVYQRGQAPAISFELFPPKSQDGDLALFQHVEALMQHRPRFVTCTYGAGGSTRNRTLDIVSRVKDAFQVPVASHLTCVGASVDDLRAYLADAQSRGIDHIVALRGDPPKGETVFQPLPNGLGHANDLVTLICREFPNFGIAVAGYPEVHQEATSADDDLARLKHKVECGADVVITQLFYNNHDFFDFERRAREAGIQVPIVPGILPVTSLNQIQRITNLCGASLPRHFVDRLGERDDPDWQTEVGVEFAADQVRDLIDHGVPGVHFYVLNRSQATCQVLDRIR